MLQYLGVILDGKQDPAIRSNFCKKLQEIFTSEIKNKDFHEYKSNHFICYSTNNNKNVETSFSKTSHQTWLALGNFYSKTPNSEIRNTIGAVSTDLKMIENSNGTWLSENYWGNYVFIMANPVTGKIQIFKDPDGLTSFFLSKLKMD